MFFCVLFCGLVSLLLFFDNVFAFFMFLIYFIWPNYRKCIILFIFLMYSIVFVAFAWSFLFFFVFLVFFYIFLVFLCFFLFCVWLHVLRLVFFVVFLFLFCFLFWLCILFHFFLYCVLFFLVFFNVLLISNKLLVGIS